MNDDGLKDLLRDHEPPEPGFTLRVLAALPRRKPRARLRLALLLSACLLGALVSLLLFGTAATLTDALAAAPSDLPRHWPAYLGFATLAATVLAVAAGVPDGD
jgi:H+/Cl- antiporter ClcA